MPGTKDSHIKILQFLVIIIILTFSLAGIQPLAFSSTDVSAEEGTDNTGVADDELLTANTPSRSRATIDRVISDDEVMYAMIAPNSYIDTLIPLANWKTYKGVPTKIYSLENILQQHTSGRDDAEKLHKFLRNLDQTSAALTWVLLAGDAGIIPIRQLYAGAFTVYHLDDDYTSDYYYAGLDNDWDSNKDGVYGDGTSDGTLKFEGDWTPNVYVGRVPAGTVGELAGYVNDVLTYEKNPPSGTWIKRAVFWGGLMNAPNVNSGEHAYHPNYTNAYRVKHHMVKPIFDENASHMYISERYDYAQMQGMNYNINNDALDRPEAKSDFNLGASIVNFAGQAYYEGVALIHYNSSDGTKTIDDFGSYDPLFNSDDAEGASNGKKLPLVTSFTCGSGDFSEGEKSGDPLTYKDRTMERLITAPNGGAIGLVASTGRTYRGESAEGVSDGNWWMDREFYELFFEGNYQAGKTLYQMKFNYKKDFLKSSNQEKYKAQLFGYNYQGDPEVDIRTDEPGTMQVEVAGLWRGSHDITITVRDMANKPINNTRVCIQNDDIYEYGVTNSTGTAVIFANPTQLGDVEVVATAHNFYYLNKTFSIGLEPADLKITVNDIKFTPPNPRVDQKVTIEASVLNRGEVALTSDFGVLVSCDGPVGSGGTQVGSEQVVSGLNPGQSKTVNVTWTVVPGQHTIFIELDPDDEIPEPYESNNFANRSIYVSRPELYITPDNITFIPDILTEKPYAGMSVEVKVQVNNIGEALANDVKVSFIARNEDMVESVIGLNKTINNLATGASKQISTNWITVGGTHEIIVKVDADNTIPEFNEANNSASRSVEVKYGPVVKPLPNLQVDEDTTTVNITELVWYISDKDTMFADLIITLNSSEPNCAVVLNEYFQLDVMASNDWHGTADVTLTASDGEASANYTFTVTVVSVPDAPRFTVENYVLIAKEDTPFSYFVTAFDPEGDAFTFFDDTDVFDIDANTGEISFTPTQEHVDNSPYRFNLTVKDSNLGTTREFELRVENVPDVPVIHSIPDQYADGGEYFNLTINAYDVDSQVLYFKDNTTLFKIGDNDGKISFIPSNSQAGTHHIKISVHDDDFLMANMTFVFQINETEEDVPVKPDNDGSDDNGLLKMGNVGGVPTLFILLIVIIIVILILVLVIKRRKKPSKPGSNTYGLPGEDEDTDPAQRDAMREALEEELGLGPSRETKAEVSPSSGVGTKLTPKQKQVKGTKAQRRVKGTKAQERLSSPKKKYPALEPHLDEGE